MTDTDVYEKYLKLRLAQPLTRRAASGEGRSPEKSLNSIMGYFTSERSGPAEFSVAMVEGFTPGIYYDSVGGAVYDLMALGKIEAARICFPYELLSKGEGKWISKPSEEQPAHYHGFSWAEVILHVSRDLYLYLFLSGDDNTSSLGFLRADSKEEPLLTFNRPKDGIEVSIPLETPLPVPSGSDKGYIIVRPELDSFHLTHRDARQSDRYSDLIMDYLRS
ncbi:MAG: hypothetical protein EOP06_05545 [Proteobacteria bacterium]|nr:MAG: hypothetical protein EOP06_05545 [Pseudomonadota bacterium]